MNKDELSGKAETLKGRIKENVGEATGDEQLRDEGVADQVEGNVREGFGKARRKVGETIEDIGERLKR